MENQLTDVQLKAIKDSIIDSMRASLSRTPLVFDPNFDKMTSSVADMIIMRTQQVLKKEVKSITIPKKEVKKIKKISKKKNARK